MSPASPARIAPSADVSPEASIGDGSSIWHLAQVREHAVLGEGCIVGRGAYIGEGVRMGRNCKVQNYALVYEPARLADGVFVGPAVTFTNDHFPRAVNPDGSLKSASDWEPVGVTVEEGASIGARAVCVAPVVIGAWATVAAGAVVTKDVPAHALVAGVPARRIGWVGRAGEPLVPVDDEARHPSAQNDAEPAAAGTRRWRCPATGALYEETLAPNSSENTIREVTH
ncbi:MULTISPECIES: acyltransferase [unclassified Actinomyces]|uniref:acyltransferase n=1 Tax=unclassified Actinomyces TaxID=2609248 RepID=UPI0013A6F457|nr:MULTISPECIES: acyltransferase [unclassified Actinomyces]MBW3068830.1 N-acetyltransferase [Actinomyces sp. 594]NDR53576.1 N-acetyltransferase [Actinomyces sp. 565]